MTNDYIIATFTKHWYYEDGSKETVDAFQKVNISVHFGTMSLILLICAGIEV